MKLFQIKIVCEINSPLSISLKNLIKKISPFILIRKAISFFWFITWIFTNKFSKMSEEEDYLFFLEENPIKFLKEQWKVKELSLNFIEAIRRKTFIFLLMKKIFLGKKLRFFIGFMLENWNFLQFFFVLKDLENFFTFKKWIWNIMVQINLKSSCLRKI